MTHPSEPALKEACRRASLPYSAKVPYPPAVQELASMIEKHEPETLAPVMDEAEILWETAFWAFDAGTSKEDGDQAAVAVIREALAKPTRAQIDVIADAAVATSYNWQYNAPTVHDAAWAEAQKQWGEVR